MSEPSSGNTPNCALSDVCASMSKLGISGDADWMAMVLFVRNILNRIEALSPRQRKELQAMVFSSIDQKNLSKENFDFIISTIEQGLEDNCAKRVRSQKDACSLEKAFSQLMETELRETLDQAREKSSKRGESFSEFGDKTVDALLKGEKRESIVKEIQVMVKSIITDLEEEAQMWERKAKQLEIRANYDPLLVHLYNRRALDMKLDQILDRHKDSPFPVCLMIIDVDHFKSKVNDAFGHQVGDEILKSLAKIIHTHAEQAKGFAARYGGEELVVVLENHDLKSAWEIAEEIRAHVEKYHFNPRVSSYTRSQSIRVTVSIGVAQLAEGWPMENLIEAADKAMYKAKRTGRNKVLAFL